MNLDLPIWGYIGIGTTITARTSKIIDWPEQGCQTAPMRPLKLIKATPGNYSLLLNAGDTPVDELVEELGHEPNGYFWEGVAQLLVSNEAPTLEGRFSYDPEGGMFCAHGEDRDALEELGALMSAVATDRDRMRGLIASAQASGFEFDD
ncbi:immunity 51 family protein [Micromonospora chersina]